MENLTFNNVYANHYNDVLNMVTYKIGQRNKELAEEITQDVFVRVHKHLNEFDEEKSSLKTWLYNIANRLVIDQWRKHTLDTMSINDEDNDGNEFLQVETTTLNPHETMVNEDLGLKIANAIDSLSKPYKNISELFFVQELTHEEIVQETGLPLNTVKGHIHRARKLLQSVLS